MHAVARRDQAPDTYTTRLVQTYSRYCMSRATRSRKYGVGRSSSPRLLARRPRTSDDVRGIEGFVYNTPCIGRNQRELQANARKHPKRLRINVEGASEGGGEAVERPRDRPTLPHIRLAQTSLGNQHRRRRHRAPTGTA
jgi:hypothetical protein